MVYYGRNTELEVISHVLHGSANDVLVCRDRRSSLDTLYLVLTVRDRACTKAVLEVFENDRRCGPEPACLERFTQNEELVLVFPYREERKFSDFAPGQMTSPALGEEICINLVMECLSTPLPWPLLELVLSQNCVQITKENNIYFTPVLDLSRLDPKRGERHCVTRCAELMLELLDGPVAGRKKKASKKLKSFELIRKKSMKGAYAGFPELYKDIKVTAIPARRAGAKNRVKGAWLRNRDGLFKVLLVVSVILVVVALTMVVSQLIFGDIPLLRLFQNTFDVIGTENLHQGGG